MSASRLRRFGRDQSGAALIETAFIAPVFFLFMFGIVQLGWALHCGASVRWALENSARALVLNPDLTEAQLQSDVAARLADVTDGKPVTVTLVREGTAPRIARASADYTHALNIPFVPAQTLRFHAQTVVPLVAN